MAKIKKEQIEDAYVRNTGDNVSGDIIGTDFVSTRDGSITRVDGLISEVALVGGRTLTISRDVDDRISTVGDGTRTWTFTRTSDQITSWAVT